MSKYAQYAQFFIEHLPHAQALGISFESCEPDTGRCVVRQTWREDLVGDPATGIVHGGVITAMLDSLAAACVIGRGLRLQATLDLRIDYLRPAATRVDLVGDAVVYRVTRHVAFVRGLCHQGDPEHAVANLTATFILEEAKS